MDKSITLKNNIWIIFFIVFATSLVFFSSAIYYRWVSINESFQKQQQTHVELLGNSVRGFLDSQGSLLEVLGVHLITQHKLPDAPIHDVVLDNTMDTYPAILGLGLVAYDGRALVTSSNFDLTKLPNLMELEQTRQSFSEARSSRKMHTGPTYIINAISTPEYGMPIRKAIYLPHDAPQAIAVMTAGIKLENTPIFSGHAADDHHKVEIIRKDRFPVFSTDGNTEYTKPVSDSYYQALQKNTNKGQAFSVFDYQESDSKEAFQIVSHYDAYLDFWFISKIEKQSIVDAFMSRFVFIFSMFFIFNGVLYVLTRSIANSEKQKQKELLQLAHHDQLTGLPNRSLLLIKLKEAISKSYVSSCYHALLFLDLDDFKTINDAHGHEYGDALLREATCRIQNCIASKDILTRFGGDEFVVLLPDLSKDYDEAALQVEEVALKILEALSQEYQLEPHSYTSSASIGAVLFNDASIEKSELLKQADIAMYKAKRTGKNSMCFFDPNMQKEVTSMFDLENELRAAIINKEFELYYQPQLDKSGTVVGAEALIRWQHPEKGLVGPYNFIPVAEKTGLILPIGEWVLETACKQLAQWHSRPETSHLSVSVNVSYKQL
nr:diguanylate cyclase [Vibrio sonorensis]